MENKHDESSCYYEYMLPNRLVTSTNSANKAIAKRLVTKTNVTINGGIHYGPWEPISGKGEIIDGHIVSKDEFNNNQSEYMKQHLLNKAEDKLRIAQQSLENAIIDLQQAKQRLEIIKDKTNKLKNICKEMKDTNSLSELILLNKEVNNTSI